MDLTDDLELVCAAYPEATIEYGTNNQPNHVLVPTEYDKTSLKLIYRRSTTNNTDLTPVLSRSAQRHVVVESKQYSLKLINSINANIAEEITRLSSDIEEDQSSFCLIQLATSILHVHIQNSSKSLVTSAPNSLLRTAQPTDSASLTTITAPVTVTVTASKTIARMLVYFHHIKSPAKKKDIVSNAAELQLCGLWKEGFPGIVIIEGEKDSCLEWVRRIQRLNWQHMVVRGEQTEEVIVSTAPVSVADSLKEFFRLPQPLLEVQSMSTMGAMCREASLHDLFMTCMKVY